MSEYLTDQEAAAYLGISVEELWTTKYRGMAPGNLAIKLGDEYGWPKAELVPPVGALACALCGRQYKTERGLAAHLGFHSEEE